MYIEGLVDVDKANEHLSDYKLEAHLDIQYDMQFALPPLYQLGHICYS